MIIIDVKKEKSLDSALKKLKYKFTKAKTKEPSSKTRIHQKICGKERTAQKSKVQAASLRQIRKRKLIS
jgi:ribosomal protein S21